MDAASCLMAPKCNHILSPKSLGAFAFSLRSSDTDAAAAVAAAHTLFRLFGFFLCVCVASHCIFSGVLIRFLSLKP